MGAMRRAVAHLLQRMATRIYNADHVERIEVTDEYGVCRCRVEVIGDDFHHMETKLELLPMGWSLGELHVGGSDPH